MHMINLPGGALQDSFGVRKPLEKNMSEHGLLELGMATAPVAQEECEVISIAPILANQLGAPRNYVHPCSKQLSHRVD